MSWKFYTPRVLNAYGTALPSTAVDGQRFTLVDSLSAPTYSWQLMYVAAKASNKWVFVGGSPGNASVATQENTTSTTYAALSTAGPSFALPYAGDYIVAQTGEALNSTADQFAIMSYDIGGTAASDDDRAVVQSATASAPQTLYRARVKTGLTAVTLTSKYRCGAGGGTAYFQFRQMMVTPIALGG